MYFDRNGVKEFKEAVAITRGPFAVYGRNMEPVISALEHYHNLPKPAYEAESLALNLILAKCDNWLRLKAAKAKKQENTKKSNDHVLRRKIAIESLMGQAISKLESFLAPAANAYATRKAAGRSPNTIPLSVGYANERTTYVHFNKAKAIGGTPLTGALRDGNDKLSPAVKGVINPLRAQGKTPGSLTGAEWQAIHTAAQVEDKKILEVRYMKKKERMRFMLEPNGKGGLRYVVGQRSAFTGRKRRMVAEVPWAMDEWGNIYCADDDTETREFAILNHSTFTSGDDVICAGMIKIDETGQILRLSNASGHYKPGKVQLQLAMIALTADYQVNTRVTECVCMTKNGARTEYHVWAPGNVHVFLGDGPPNEVIPMAED